MKKVLYSISIFITSIFLVLFLSSGVYALTKDSYSAGQASIKPQVVNQTLAILNLSEENSALKSEVLTIQGEYYSLKILAQTQAEELDNLKSTVDSLNQSIIDLESDNANLDSVITKLNNDVTYLNDYVSKLETVMSNMKNTYAVLVLPQEFASSTAIYAYQYLDKIYLCSPRVSDMRVYHITTGTYTTCVNWDNASHSFGGNVVFYGVWNGKLLFNLYYGVEMYAIDVETDIIEILAEISFKGSKSVVLFANDILIFSAKNNTCVYNDIIKQYITLPGEITGLSATDPTSYMVLNNKLYIHIGGVEYCIDLFDLTYKSYKFSSGSYVYVTHTERHIYLTSGNDLTFTIIDTSTFEVLLSETLLSGIPRSPYKNYHVLTENYYYIICFSHVSYLNINDLSFVTIGASVKESLNFETFVMGDIVMAYNTRSSDPGVYKIDATINTVTLLNESLYGLKWLLKNGTKWLVSANNKLYVYDIATFTFTEFSDVWSLTYITEIGDYYYFGSYTKVLGIVKIDKEFTTLETVYSMNRSCSVFMVFEEYNYAILTADYTYIFDFETLEVSRMSSSIISVGIKTKTQSGEDWYLEYSSGHTYYLDVSERTLTLYSYGMELE